MPGQSRRRLLLVILGLCWAGFGICNILNYRTPAWLSTGDSAFGTVALVIYCAAFVIVGAYCESPPKANVWHYLLGTLLVAVLFTATGVAAEITLDQHASVQEGSNAVAIVIGGTGVALFAILVGSLTIIGKRNLSE
jgi:heme A synthase